ncbi:MAG: S8 family serine peptidase, partial [Rubripirellula sp.]
MKRTNTRSSQQKFLRASDAARLGKRHQLRLQLEKLESRQLLASDLGDSWSWFQSFDDVPRIAPAELATSSQYDPSFVGPRDLVASEWIVQLTDDAIRSLDSIESLNGLLDRNPVDLTLVAGLGSSGSVLLRGVSGSHEDVQRVLAGSDHVDSFSANRLIEGQLTPNDPEFVTGLLPGLDLVDANDAWDVSIGSLSTVVGVVDTGIDSTHPDLYLNIWLNQGELPPEFLDDEGNKLVDIDADGLITFYDLNNATRSATAPFSLTVGGFATGPNAEFVRDLNGNGRIDAQDLLADANWADGRDTDNNGFFDDFFGVNFRAGADDLLASNDPSDPLGHGTHVAGTIGAVGGNGTGVVGVNWQTSLMSLRILDNNNQGDSGAAIAAINYARQMREQLTTGSDNRVTEGANVRVLNNSWGQPGGYEQSLEAAIIDTNDAGILFVAAAGNGNILGNGVDNDRTPFYPASYDSPNVIAVAASDASDNLATFSNFGRTSVDLVAPGVGIRSTVAGGGYGSANGTSMATPHVAGTAALIWAALPQSTVAEIRDAILGSVQTIPALSEVVATGGRLDAVSAINSNVFAPAAELISKQDISLLGGSTSSFTVRYTHRDGINAASTGDDDVVITRQWGPEVTIPARRTSFSELNGSVTVTYEVDAPGGSWDALDFGDYVISTLPDSVLPAVGSISIRKRELGSFNVRITDDPSVLYATGFNDLLEPGTLRSRITEANAASPTLTTIILDTGRYTIDIPGVVDPDSSFGSDLELAGLQNPGEWFTTSTGDFDITGNVTIVGDTNDETIVDAQGLSRVFKVHSSGTLNLSRLTLQGGVASGGQGGGGIVSLGQLSLDSVIARDNSALSSAEAGLGYGGAIAAFGGNAQLDSSWLSENDADFGGGIHFAGDAGGGLQRSTVSDNQGGGFESLSSQDLSIRNSTFSANTGGHGAIANGLFFNFLQANAESYSPTISADGRFVVFHSDASNLVAGDINNDWDIFVHDRVDNTIEMVSVDNNGVQSNGRSYDPSVSSDGRFIVYQSSANNLVPDDDDSDEDLFVYDRTTQTTERISVGISTASASYSPSISADGRFVAFVSFANDLVANDTNSNQDVFVYDRDQDSFELISVQSDGTLVTGTHRSPSISANGQYVVFESSSTTLVPNDNNSEIDVFIRDRTGLTTEIVSISSAGIQGDDYSRRASISADGRYVAFESQASNFVPDDDNLNSDVFIRDRVQNTTELVSVELVGVAGPNFSINASISADGRYVAFLSHGSNLVANDINGKSDILVRDRILNTTELISVSSSSVQGNEGSGLPSISADGRFVVFDSDASNLVHGDENGIQDIFVRDRVDSTTYSPVVQPPTSLLTISHVTVTSTSSDFEYAVFGDAQVENSLFSGNQVSTDLHPRSAIISSSNVFSDTETSDLIGPLRRFEQLPPTHRLILGNVAIDAATTSTNPEADQLGRSRGDSPDIGALEAIEASLSGVVFFDANQNGVLDFGEQGLSELIVGISDGVGSEESSTNASEGRYSFDRLNTGSYQVTVEIEEDSWSVSTPEIRKVRAATIESNNFSVEPSISGDGQFVAFTSNANNLVPVDENNHTDIFVYDRLANSNELANVHNDGSQSNDTSGSASISNDGRYVAFVSRASNLVDNDNNSVLDVFVHDRLNDTTDIVSMRSDGASGNGISRNPSISSDGRYVTFESAASDLVANDNNGTSDIFIHDRVSNTTELVSVRSDGGQGNGDSSSPSVSADGRYIAFASFARNLVDQSYFVTAIFIRDRLEGTTELVSQFGSNSNPVISQDGRFVTFHGFGRVYVYDRVQGTSEFASVNDSGALGNGQSSSPSISADGRFVAFSSSASDLVAGDSNGQGDVFIRDLLDDTTVRVSVSSDSLQGNDDSSAPSISPDGRFVAFQSFASNLTELDNNGQRDIFVSFNPLADPNVLLRDLKAGEVETALNIGLVPNPGLISGRLFSDTGVENGVFDLGEETLSSKQIFIDANRNGVFDDGELQATTDAEGRYEFADVQSFREHSLVTAAPSGFQQVGLDGDGEFGVSLFLPAGGTISGLDIGFRRVTSSGQSSASALSGRLFEDKNDNGVFDSGVDVPLVGREVYLDAANFGVRDPNEPRELTDADGVYSFAGLSSRNVAVSTTLDETLVHTSPLGSDFQLTKSPLFPTVQPFGNPQAIASGDFDQDGFLDVVVALGEGNKLSIRLNDGAGGFKPDLIDVDLGTAGSGPTSIVVGQFDADTRLDVALTANFASNVVVLLNFDPATQSFDSQSTITVGEEPIDIGFGLFNGDVHLDLVVVNKGNGSIANDESVMLLTNDGNGVFTAGPPIPTGGTDSVELVAGEFTGDAFLDVAVVHSSPASTTTTSGGVTVLAGDGAGSLSHNGNYDEVGAFPIDAASADFDGDGRSDLAVANFNSNSISILLGQADGTFRVQPAILGTASGAFDIAVADIDNDGDQDVIASNLRDRNISIFRNTGVDSGTGDVQFQPLENIGLGQFSLAQRMPLVVANFDNDTSGPGGSGTVDIVTI